MSVILQHIQIAQSSGKSPIGLIELNRSLLFFCFLCLLFSFFFLCRTVVITLTTTSDRKRELASREHADNWDPCLSFSLSRSFHAWHNIQCCSVRIDDEPGENRTLDPSISRPWWRWWWLLLFTVEGHLFLLLLLLLLFLYYSSSSSSSFFNAPPTINERWTLLNLSRMMTNYRRLVLIQG